MEKKIVDSYILANQNQADVDRLIFLSNLVKRKDCVMVEIGSYRGGSATIIGESIKGLGKLYCVENCDQDSHASMIELPDNLRRHGLLGNTVEIIYKSSIEAVNYFADESLTMVYIDGDHSYFSFKEDVTVWLPKVEIGGILCGHDCAVHYMKDLNEQQRIALDNATVVHVNGVTYPIDCRFLGEPFDKWERWAGWPTMHPGVVKGVWECLGDKFDLPKKGSCIWSYRKE